MRERWAREKPGIPLDEKSLEYNIFLFEAIDGHRNPRDTDSFREAVGVCAQPPLFDVNLSLALAAVLTLILWSIAYVIGGSFWRLPRGS